MRRRAAALALGWITLAACSTPEAARPSLPFEPWQEFELAAEHERLVGLPELEEEFGLRNLDTAVYGLRAYRGSEVEEIVVTLRSVESFENSTPVTIFNTPKDGERRRIEVEDRQVEVIEAAVTRDGEAVRATLLIPRFALRLTPYHTSLANTDRDDAIMAMMSIVMLLNAWQEHEELKGLLDDLVGRPPLSALIRVAIDRSYSIRQRQGRDIYPEKTFDVAGRSIPGTTVEYDLAVGGTKLMGLEVDVVDSVAPLSIAAGVVAIRATSPRDPSRRIELRLLGARRPTRQSAAAES